MSARGWYLMLTDPDANLDGLIGPLKGGKEQGERLMALLLDRDRQLAEAVDWDSPDCCAPYWFTRVQVVDLTPVEVHALTGQSGRYGLGAR